MARLGGPSGCDLPADAWRGLPRRLLSVRMGGPGDKDRRPPPAAVSDTSGVAAIAGRGTRGAFAASRSTPRAHSVGSRYHGRLARGSELSISRRAGLGGLG